MTREESNELIDMLTIIKGQAIKSDNDTAIINIKIDSLNFVVDKAIKALEQEPCDDCISREEVLKLFGNSFYNWELGLVKKKIDKLPSVQPKQRTGHWIETKREPWYRCSRCNEKVFGSYKNYCPNCGAKMG